MSKILTAIDYDGISLKLTWRIYFETKKAVYGVADPAPIYMPAIEYRDSIQMIENPTLDQIKSYEQMMKDGVVL